jgi:uncharacterized protein YoxC
MPGAVFNAVRDLAGWLGNLHLGGNDQPQNAAGNSAPVIPAPIALPENNAGGQEGQQGLPDLGVHIHYTPAQFDPIKFTPFDIKKDSPNQGLALLRENVQIFERNVMARRHLLDQVKDKDDILSKLQHRVAELSAQTADKSMDASRDPEMQALLAKVRNLAIDIPRDHPLSQVGKVQFTPAEVRQVGNWIEEVKTQLKHDSQEFEHAVTKNYELMMKLYEILINSNEKMRESARKIFQSISGSRS